MPQSPRNLKIGVIVPTRGRPGNVERLGAFFRATRQLETTKLIWCIDRDDATGPYGKLLDTGDRTLVGPRRNMARWTNYACKQFQGDFDVFASWGDDHLPRTPGWDATISEVLAEDGPAIAYGNDLYQGPRLPTAPFISREVIEALGFMCPPGFEHMFIDNYWRELGKRTGRLLYCPWVVIEHLHPQANKAQWDASYKRTHQFTPKDQATAAAYEASGALQADIDRVIEKLGEVPVVGAGHS